MQNTLYILEPKSNNVNVVDQLFYHNIGIKVYSGFFCLKPCRLLH